MFPPNNSISDPTSGDIFAGLRVHIGNLSALVRKSHKVAASAWNSPVAQTMAVLIEEEAGFEEEEDLVDEEVVFVEEEGAGVEEEEGVLAPEFSADDAASASAMRSLP